MGVLDLAENLEDEFSTLTEITQRIASATEAIGEKIKDRTAEITELSTVSDTERRKGARRIMERVAADMDHYVHRMESELPFFQPAFELWHECAYWDGGIVH